MASSIAVIHIAKKQLGLDEDTYRGKLQLITGKSSTKDMSESERQQVLTVFRNEGFTPVGAARREDGRQKLTGKFAKKLQALWIAGYNLGIVRDRDDAALESFIKRQTGIERERWLRHADDASKVIDALKGWIAREAGVDWSTTGLHPQSHLRATGYKIAAAQWAIISPADRNGFWPAVVAIVGGSSIDRHLDDAQWILVMNTFGERVRSSKAASR